jgi:hypothetical protein
MMVMKRVSTARVVGSWLTGALFLASACSQQVDLGGDPLLRGGSAGTSGSRNGVGVGGRTGVGGSDPELAGAPNETGGAAGSGVGGRGTAGQASTAGGPTEAGSAGAGGVAGSGVAGAGEQGNAGKGGSDSGPLPDLFRAGITYPAGKAPRALAVGDIDGDQHDDLVVISDVSVDVSILLNRGNGSFEPRIAYAAGTTPSAVAVGDLNGDGRPEIVVASADQTMVRVFPNGGNGESDGYGAPAAGLRMVMADFNADTALDVALAHEQGEVSVLLNDGQGSLLPPIVTPIGSPATALAAGDLDRDGRTDLVVGASVGLALLFGTGAGGFADPLIPPLGLVEGRSSGVVIADVTGDGALDASLAHPGGSLTLLVNEGDRSFAVMPPRWTPAPVDMTGADLDGDAVAELVVAHSAWSGLSVFSELDNLGPGMKLPDEYAAGYTPYQLATGDLNGDGTPDLALVHDFGVTVVLGDGAGGLVAGRSHALSGNVNEVVVEDFNGDGALDLAGSSGSMEAALSVALNASGNFPSRTYAADAGFAAVASGDFDGDQAPDLVVLNQTDSMLGVLKNIGAGMFAAPVTYPVGPYPLRVRVGDLDVDGALDLVVPNNESNHVSLLFGSGDGAFRPPYDLPGDLSPVDVAIGDLDGDGAPELAVTSIAASSLSIYHSAGNGGFESRVVYSVSGATGVAMGDLDGDGKPDLAVSEYTAGKVHVLLNDGNGSFGTVGAFPASFGAGMLVIRDFDGNGHADIAVTCYSGSLSVILATGDGSFFPGINYAVGFVPNSPQPFDMNGDGLEDIVNADGWAVNVTLRER